MAANINFLDCTFRDGGYYNDWDFTSELIDQYLEAMQAAEVDVVELGFRTLENNSFLGPCAFTTDEFLRSLNIPSSLSVSVMINGSELCGSVSLIEALEQLFPSISINSPVDIVRFACHLHEFERVLPAVNWLKERGYQVGINLMQVADRSEKELKTIARLAAAYPLDVLYFADSMGSMCPQKVAKIIRWIRSEWSGALGIHTHDNLGLALPNTLRALDEGVTWVDSTMTGMGRGPGNARTEELAIEIAERREKSTDIVPLMILLKEYFKPMQNRCGWGTNPFYYLAGKYGIHPTYIQEMISDLRYNEEDILAVIERLRLDGGKKFSSSTLDAVRNIYYGEPFGLWSPKEIFAGRDILILATGPGVTRHRYALERFIIENKPLVLAMNTQSTIDAKLIDLRVASHPVRLLADCKAHLRLPQPLIIPYSMLSAEVRNALMDKYVLDFGLSVQAGKFIFSETYCVAPTALVMAYAFAIAASGEGRVIYLAGFDGYPGEDLRNEEMNNVIKQFQAVKSTPPLIAITPSRYDVAKRSVYGMVS
jgi:4-hydroxy 2-oxovalerate aldolase